MKRFCGSLLLLVFAFCLSVFSLTACTLPDGITNLFGGGSDGSSSGTVGWGDGWQGGTGDQHVHTWCEWETKREATCISTGLEWRICKTCQKEESRTLEITSNHDFKSDVCTLCGYVSGLDDYFTFTKLSDGTYSIAAKQYVPKNIIIPSEYNGCPVTVIGTSGFSKCKFIENVEIPDTIVKIEEYAFAGCDHLTRITISQSVTQIGNEAFAGCSASLESITVKSENPNYHSENNCLIETATNTLLLGCESSVIPSYITKIGDRSFDGCASLAEISLPEGVTEIGDRAFLNCESLLSISLPDGVTYIGNGAFSGCTSLKAFTIPSRVRSIEQDTFNDCVSLESLYIPKGITSIHANPFVGCSAGLLSIEVDEQNIYFSGDGNCLINKREKALILGCKNSVIPDYVTKIGSKAFYGCVGLTDITIPDSVTDIGGAAFENCTELRSITLSKNVKEIKGYAFYNCHNLKNATFPDGITTIGAFAFYECGSLEELILPDTVSRIERSAFEGCSSLCSFTFPESIEFIGDGAFSRCYNIHTVTISTSNHLKYLNSSLGSYKAVELYNLSDTNITPGQDGYGSSIRYIIRVIHTSQDEASLIENISDYLFLTLGDEYYLLGYVGCDSELILPDDYRGNPYHIYPYAFVDNSTITKVTFSDGVLSIGTRAFMDCYNLISITLNASLTSIEDQAFYNCHRLSEIYNLPSLGGFGYYSIVIHTSLSEESAISQVEDFLFITYKGENYLLGYVGDSSDIRLPDSFKGGAYGIWPQAFYKNQQIKSVIIPNSVTSIESSAFQYCEQLESVVFEDDSRITEIPYQAFQGCKSIKSISLPDSVVSIENDAFSGCTALINIELSQNLTEIKSSAFDFCDGIVNQYKGFRYVGVGDNPYYILLGANDNFYSDYNNTVTYCDVFYKTCIIASGAFYKYVKLDRVTLNDGLIGIGSYAFYGCESLKSITIPDTVKRIGESAFMECSTLVNVDLPDGACVIESYAFSECQGLRSITIPKEIASIEEYAFLYCDKLIEVYNLSSIELTTYHGIDESCIIHTSLNEASAIKQSGDYLFISKDGKHYLIEYYGTQSDIVLPSSYNGSSYEIFNCAFYGRSDITSVVIPDGVTAIGSSAFYQCKNLKKVTIGKNVTLIEYSAFAHCLYLDEVIFANPSGWYCDGFSKLDEKELSDASTAARYLVGERAFYYWQRK